jgi:hypothetical protein
MQANDSTKRTRSEASAVDQGSPVPYEIRVKGHLDARWAAWFDGLSLTNEGDGATAIRGPLVDQAALHGLLQRLRDLGVPLVSVTQVNPPALTHPSSILDELQPRREPT